MHSSRALRATITAAVFVATLATVIPAALLAPATAAPTAITIERAGSGAVVSGEKVAFRGEASRALRGEEVKLQRKVGSRGQWVTVARTKVARDLSYIVRGLATGVGQNSWRVSGEGEQSPTVRTTVFQWFFLADRDPVEDNRFTDEAVRIGGTRYARSVVNSASFWYDEEAWGEWNLGYRCRSFEASIGLTDESATGSLVEFLTSLDGGSTSHGVKGLGRAQKVQVDVRQRLRLRLTSRYVDGPTGSGDTTGWGAWGNARVLCSRRI